MQEVAIMRNEKTCQHCGNSYIGTKIKYCSDECVIEVRKIRNREKVRELNKTVDVEKSCKNCGNNFKTKIHTKITCSKKCSRRWEKRKKNQRLNKLNIVDNDITLESLYKRDLGICYICGLKCNWDDYIKNENNYIVGNNYPSVDHLNPLSLGGLHAWNNIKLAHHKCNRLKSDEPLPENIIINDAYKYKTNKRDRRKKTLMRSIDGELINTFNSTSEAESTTGIKQRGIQKCARGECKTYNGYVWEYI